MRALSIKVALMLGASVALLVGVAQGAMAGSATSGRGAGNTPAPELITGEVLELISLKDAARMSTMRAGDTVDWDIGVSANRSDGAIAKHLVVDMTAPVFTVQVRWCPERWVGTTCRPGEHNPLVPITGNGTYQLPEQSCASQRWYRVSLTYTGTEPARANIRFAATAHGEELSTDGVGMLADTGAQPARALWLASGVIGVGIALSALARIGRRG